MKRWVGQHRPRPCIGFFLERLGRTALYGSFTRGVSHESTKVFLIVICGPVLLFGSWRRWMNVPYGGGKFIPL